MSFEIEKDERNMGESPYYGIYKHYHESASYIVLFTDTNTGVVISSNDKDTKVGKFSKFWNENSFVKLNTGDRIIIDIEGAVECKNYQLQLEFPVQAKQHLEKH